MAAKMLTAKVSFACTIKGVEHIVVKGEKLPSTHAIVKGREELFEPAGEAAR